MLLMNHIQIMLWRRLLRMVSNNSTCVNYHEDILVNSLIRKEDPSIIVVIQQFGKPFFNCFELLFPGCL